MTSASTGQLADPAWSDPAARATVRQVGRIALLNLVAGLVFLAGTAIIVVLVDRASDEWHQRHGQTTGTVFLLQPDLRRHYRPGSVSVRYSVDGQQLGGEQYVGQLYKYQVDETVTVYYDRADPSRFAIKGETNQSSWSVSLMTTIGFLLSSCSFIVAGVVGLSWHRLRRVLRSCSWQPAWFEPLPRIPRHNQEVLVRLAEPEGDCPHFSARITLSRNPLRRSPDVPSAAAGRWLPGQIAGPVGRWAVLADADATGLVPVRRLG